MREEEHQLSVAEIDRPEVYGMPGMSPEHQLEKVVGLAMRLAVQCGDGCRKMPESIGAYPDGQLLMLF